MKNILVLGGSGFVGCHVCEKLVRAGHTVTVATRRRSHAAKVQHLPGLSVVECDVHQPQALAQAVAGFDAVVNLIAILHGTPAAFDKVHVALPRNLVKACTQAGVAELVHISALGVNANTPAAAPSNYLRSKGYGEAVLAAFAAASGAAVTLIRPSVIFGREDNFLNMFARLQRVFPLMPLAGAQARFQPVWVEDVASAVVNSLDPRFATPGLRVLEACGPQVYTLKQLVQIAARLGGVNEGRGRPVLGLPAWAGQLQALAMECLPGVPLMSRDNLASMLVDNVASAQVAGLQTLGITPAAMEAVAADYLAESSADHGLLGLRIRH